MIIKVFISHKDIDYGIAIQVQNILKKINLKHI